MLYVYIVCLVFGVGYSVVSAVFGSHGLDHGGGLEHGGGFDHSGFDHAGGTEGHQAADNGNMPSPFNPLVIASAITAFGAIGLIGKAGFSWSDFFSAVIALGFAGAIGAAMFFGIVKVMYNQQSNSVFSLEQLEGIEAEVITPVPEKGLGEITYVINGMRSSLSAKSLGNVQIQRGRKVIIREVAGNYAVVQEKITVDDLTEFETNDEKSKKDKMNNIL